MWIPINTLIILLLFSGIIWLEYYLSKQENKWLGLILPIISFVFSMMSIFSMIVYWTLGTTSMTSDGIIMSESTIAIQPETTSIVSMLATAVPTFLISNIPTLILLAIYFAARRKLQLRNELDKMNVQDLD